MPSSDARSRGVGHEEPSEGKGYVMRDELSETIFRDNLDSIRKDTDQLFFWLLIAQWILATGLALGMSPYTWNGSIRSMHVHIYIATCFGGAINVLPLFLIRNRPGSWFTRHT